MTSGSETHDGAWDGIYLDGQTPQPRPVHVTLTSEGVSFQGPGVPTSVWPWAEVRQTQGRYAGEPTRLERPRASFEALIVEDSGFGRALAGVHLAARRFRVPLGRGALVGTVVGGSLLVAALVAGLYLRGIPGVAGWLAWRLPPAMEERLGKMVEDVLAPEAKRCDDAELQADVEAVLERLLAAAPPSHYAIRVDISSEPVLNAFALPGGRVVVFRGLLQRTRRPEELAGVLAHEMQHVLRRHTTQALLRGLSVKAAMAAASPEAKNLLGPAELLGSLKLSREAEAEADSAGFRLLLDANVDGKGMVDAFRMLQKSAPDVPSGLAFLSDHPKLDDRIAGLARMTDAARQHPEPIHVPYDWQASVKRCWRSDKPVK